MVEFFFGLLGIVALVIYVAIAAGLGFLILPPVIRFIERHFDDPVGTWIAIAAYLGYVVFANKGAWYETDSMLDYFDVHRTKYSSHDDIR